MWSYISISAIVLLASLIYHYHLSRPVSIVDRPGTNYDYIVVGAGTSGCVIASGLSEMQNVSVLLVEAGGYFGWLATVPLMAPLMQGGELDWIYKTESQKFSSDGLWNNQQKWPRGKGLGGSGQLNYLVHSYGRPEDYKKWPKGWSHADLLPYFKKVSDVMNVMTMSAEEPLADAFVAAESAFKSENVTLQMSSYTANKGGRWSTYHAYLQNAWHRRNLHILMNTLVTRIIFDGTKAAGIEVAYKDGSLGRIKAKKEIILCGGTINTPQLLMVSGVGPVEELQKHSIPVVKNLSAVGKNLFDHMNAPVYVNLKSPISITLRKMQSLHEVLRYLIFGTGMLSTNAVMGIGRSNNSGLILFGMASTDEKLLKAVSNYRTETFRSLFPAHNDSTHEGFLYLATCLQPKSRGSITLRSNNIMDPPKIDPAYLQHDDDVLCTHNAINLGLETLNTKAFRRYGATIHVPDFEECRHLRQDYRDADYSECVMRIGALTSHHPCGTCRMGKDNESVVDKLLRVRGVSGLRIMDASVVPSPISGTPNSVLIAMAERAIDVILDRTSD